MTRTIAGVCLWAVLAATAYADRLDLVDGRTFEGLVTVDGDTVTVKMTYGSLQFSQREVARITYMDTPEEVLAKKTAAASPDSADELFAVARWAFDNALDRQGKELLGKVIAISADHAGARRRLLHARIDDKWYTFDEALELARGKLQAERYDDLLAKVFPPLKDLPLSSSQRNAVQDIRARTHLQAGQFTDARGVFATLADRGRGPAGVRYTAIATILAEHSDGMYIVRDVYPPQATLLRTKGPILSPGPASLSRPIVLDAALHDLANRTEIEAGKKLLAEAREAERTEPSVARTKYALATQRFERADAIVAGTPTPEIAKTYHVEIARRRISAIRKVVDDEAEKCDKIRASLGQSEMSKKAYRAIMTRLLYHLGSAREALNAILALAKPYPGDLILEIKWAEVDLKKIEGWRKVLATELDDGK